MILSRTIGGMNYSSVLVEKSKITVSDQKEPTSSSRLIAFIGSTVLATFLWGLGNVLLYKGILAKESADFTNIKEMLSAIGNFFLAGAALFAPYAFNQLSTVFTPKPPNQS